MLVWFVLLLFFHILCHLINITCLVLIHKIACKYFANIFTYIYTIMHLNYTVNYKAFVSKYVAFIEIIAAHRINSLYFFNK